MVPPLGWVGTTLELSDVSESGTPCCTMTDREAKPSARSPAIDAVVSGERFRLNDIIICDPHCLDQRDEEGRNALLLACLNGDIAAAEMLVTAGSSPENQDTDPLRGGKAIHYAAWGGHISMVKWLLANGANLHDVDLVGNTCLLYAVYGGHLELVQMLLEYGCSLQEKNNKGHSAIIQASCGGHCDMVRWLVDRGASVRERDDVGNTSLLFAAWGGHIEVLEWLLDNGASLDEKSDTGHTALLSAANAGKQKVVEWLIDRHGACLHDRNTNGDSALLLAAFGGHCEFFLWLLSRGCIAEDENNDGLNPLLSACNGGHRDMVQLLLDHGCSPDVSTASGYTPLILAACGGHLDLMKWLVQIGCSLDSRTKEGDTSLLLACYCGHVDIVRWILDTSSQSISERNAAGLTPLISAANGGSLDVIQLLLDRGSEIEESDDDGYTPVLLAARRGFLSVVQYLAARGADLHRTIAGTDEDIYSLSMHHDDVYDWLDAVRYFTPLHIAANVGSVSAVKRLLYYGEDPTFQVATCGSSEMLGSHVSPIDVARAYVKNVSPTPKLVRTLRLAASPWTPGNHFLFGSSFRVDVVKVMLVWYRLRTSTFGSAFDLPLLPPELWFRIAAMLPRRDCSTDVSSCSMPVLTMDAMVEPGMTDLNDSGYATYGEDMNLYVDDFW